jgi:hypothetical protein
MRWEITQNLFGVVVPRRRRWGLKKDATLQLSPNPIFSLVQGDGAGHRLKPGNANLPIAGLHVAIQENGVPGGHHQMILRFK